MSAIVPFTHRDSIDKSLVGGKAGNLAVLTQAGFAVPQGFTVSTSAYTNFLKSTDLETRINAILDTVSYDRADDLESQTASIRKLVLESAMPVEVSGALLSAYEALGGSYVAVRSSGTAEDLAEASFAGLHDTILDVKGAGRLQEAVKECWASLFSSRATSYRHRNGFDHSEARLAVVVQRMIPAESAGVLFTGNPMSTSTQECVINSSFGLGEAVVSSLVTPDSYIVKSSSLKVRAKELGTKEFLIRRDPSSPSGTVKEEVSEAERERFSLTEEQAQDLVRLGLRVQKHYGSIPQDIEWAFEGGRFYLLQSRPITGVEFSWSEDVTGSELVEYDDELIWTRAWADELWSGPVSPLFFSVRTWTQNVGFQAHREYWKVKEIYGQSFFKYHKACAYFNTSVERGMLTTLLPPVFRPGAMARIPPLWHEEVLKAPFSWITYLKMIAGIELVKPTFYQAFEDINVKWHNKWVEVVKGFTKEKFREMGDYELVSFTDKLLNEELEWIYDGWNMLFVYGPSMVSLLHWIGKNWYDPADPDTFSAILIGNPVTTQTMQSDHKLWELANRIRQSPSLLKMFQTHQELAFFKACKSSAEGSKWLSDYNAFAEEYKYRGHQDRDIYFPRRIEDPSIDYRAIAAILKSSNTAHPRIKEEETNRIRAQAAEKVVAHLQTGLLGVFKAEIFKLVYDWYLKFQSTRDDFRADSDMMVYGWRLGYNEIGRRLKERGVFQEEDDHFWLARTELYPVFFGSPITPLLKLKMIARKRDFMRRFNGEIDMPMYIQHEAPVDLELPSEDEPGLLKGIGTSRGKITGIACVVRQLKDIGRIPDGAILCVNSTDPAWSPVFNTISAIVLETGGLLAHGSCLAREYNLPAVQIPYAMSKIPDGARIEVDGGRGTVTLLDYQAEQSLSQGE